MKKGIKIISLVAGVTLLNSCNALIGSSAGSATVVNVAPVASELTVAVNKNTSKSITLLANDSNVGDSLTFTIVDGPSNGSLSGTAPAFTFTPGNNYIGNDSFTFIVSDGKLDSEVATISLVIGANNQAPVASAQTVNTNHDVASAITLSATDSEGDTLSYSLLTSPIKGALSGTAPNFTYTPNVHYIGADSFTFKANDGNVDSDPVTVTINVNQVILYFCNQGDSQWESSANWFLNSDCNALAEDMVLAGRIPADGDSVYMDGSSTFSDTPSALDLYSLTALSFPGGSESQNLNILEGGYFEVHQGNWYGSIGAGGTTYFYTGASNFGTVNSDAEFWDYGGNFGSVNGNALFANGSINGDGGYTAGNVAGNADFYGSGYNNSDGYIGGDANFYEGTSNRGNVDGTGYFYELTYNDGVLNGDVYFNDSSYNNAGTYGSTCYGNDGNVDGPGC